MSFEQMWRDLAPVGRSARTGGYFRQPFTTSERECADWFAEQALSRGLALEGDVFGNRVAWWHPADRDARRFPAVLTGSHLDSVRDGGAFDGPLGVVSALAAVDVLHDRGFTPTRPLGIATFVEEEGSRFGLACLGSQLATGALSPQRAKELRDPDGVLFPDALEQVGLHHAWDDWLHGAWLGDRVACFVELHVEQGRNLVHRDAPVGVASAIWPHGRYRFDVTGEANHAGTTRMRDRRDPMLTYAMTALAANKQARLAAARATFGRLHVEPNGTNAVPSRVTAWLDARAESDEGLDALLATVEKQAVERAGRDGTQVTVTAESVSPRVDFDVDLLRRISEGRDWPVIPTAAGHDAGVLQSAGIPTAMLFVRNPTGVSHAPTEHADMADCLAGVEALADTLQRLTS